MASTTTSNPPADLSDPPGLSGAFWRLTWPLTALLVVLAATMAWGLPNYVSAQMNAEHYQFVLFVPFGSAFLLWYRKPTFVGLKPGNPLITAGAFAVAGLFLFDWLLTRSLSNWGLVMVFAALGVIWGIGGWGLFRQTWQAWIVLWMMVRPPLGLDQRFIGLLQLWASSIASILLDMVGVVHVQEGNVIHLESQPLFVAEACSGVNSLFVTFAVLVFAMFLFRRSLTHAVALFALGFLAVMVVNVFRVSCLTWFHWYSDDLGEFFDGGIPHTAFGLGCFALLIGLLVSADALLFILVDRFLGVLPERLVGRILQRLGDGPKTIDVESDAEWNVREQTHAAASLVSSGARWRWLVPLTAFTLFLGLESTALGLAMTRGGDANAELLSKDPLAGKLNAETLPPEWEGWRRTNFTEHARGVEFVEANFSSSWEYRRGQTEVMYVHLHRTYSAYHALDVCYRGNGWSVEGLHSELDQKKGLQYLACNIRRNPDGVYGLAYTFGDLGNQVWLPPHAEMTGDMALRFKNSLKYRTSALKQLFNRSAEQTVLAAGLVVQVQSTADEANDQKLAVDRLLSVGGRLFANFKPTLNTGG